MCCLWPVDRCKSVVAQAGQIKSASSLLHLLLLEHATLCVDLFLSSHGLWVVTRQLCEYAASMPFGQSRSPSPHCVSLLILRTQVFTLEPELVLSLPLYRFRSSTRGQILLSVLPYAVVLQPVNKWSALGPFPTEHFFFFLTKICRAMANGRSFLKSIQRPDGSWYGSWGVCFTYGTVDCTLSIISLPRVFFCFFSICIVSKNCERPEARGAQTYRYLVSWHGITRPVRLPATLLYSRPATWPFYVSGKHSSMAIFEISKE